MTLSDTKRFRVLDRLGEGGMGIVYDVYDETRQMRVALKALRHASAHGLYRFKREFRAMSDLSHPNLVSLYELVADGEQWFFTMEMVDGVDFASHVRADPRRAVGMSEPEFAAGSQPSRQGAPRFRPGDETGSELTTRTVTSQTSRSSAPAGSAPLPSESRFSLPRPPAHRPHIATVADLGRLRHALPQLASAVVALHSVGIIHRDLKPANVLITGAGRVVVLDFGIVAETSRPSDSLLARVVSGTPTYMAPELADRVVPDAAADWYAVGVMLYLALTGRVPFGGVPSVLMAAKQEFDPLPPEELVTGVPEDLARMCMGLLRRDPDQRFGADEVLALLGGRASMAVPVALQAPAPTDVFVGRDRELAELDAAYAAVRDEGARCVLVEGPSGMGKSTLVARFVERMQQGEAGPKVLSSQCHERESLAYKAFDGIVDELGYSLLRLSETRLRQILPPDVAALARLFPTLSRVPGCQPGAGVSSHGPREQRARAVEALRGLFAALSEQRPLVLRVEDLQWADEDSLELFDDLLRPPIAARVLIVATVRTEAGTEASTEAGTEAVPPALVRTMATLQAGGLVVRVPLGPLPEDEQHALVRALSGGGAIPDAVDRTRRTSGPVDRTVWEQAAGHPMLLTELARFGARSSPAIGPDRRLDLTEVIWQRCERLPRGSRALLELIAVAGEPTPLEVLARGSGLAGSERERAWSGLRVGRLARRVARGGPRLFVDAYHDKVRESILGHLPDGAREALHAQLARSLEGWPDARAASIGRHWVAAGHVHHGARFLLEAAEQAAGQLALARAEQLYRSVLDLLAATPEGSIDPGDTIDRTAGPPHSIDRSRYRAWLGLAAIMRITEHNDEALAMLERAEAVAGDGEFIEERASLHLLRGNLLFPTGDTARCLAEHGKALGFARAAGSLEVQARALGGMSDAYVSAGRMISAAEKLDACLALARAHGLVPIEVAHLALRGWCHFYQNQVDDAIRTCEEAIAGAIRIGHQRAEHHARAIIGMMLTELRRLDDADHHLRKSVAIARRLGMRRFELSHHSLLGRIIALRGDRAAAQALIDDLIASCRSQDLTYGGPMMLGALAFVTDDPDVLADALARAEGYLRGGSPRHNYLYFCRDAMDAAWRFGDADRLDRYATMLEDCCAVEPMPWSRYFVAWGRALAARCRDRRGDPARLGLLAEEANRIGFTGAAEALARARSVGPPPR